jgi:hypothetical protein
LLQSTDRLCLLKRVQPQNRRKADKVNAELRRVALNRFNALATVLSALGLVITGCGPSAPSEHVRVLREVALSQHLVSPYVIVRAPDRGYVITGSDNISDTHGWATRVDSNGKQLWEFLDGPPESWRNLTPPNINRFNGAVVLPDDRTLLCGVKDRSAENNPGHLVLIDSHGAISAEQDLYPGGDAVNYSSEFVNCLRWRDGIGGREWAWPLVRMAREA